MTVTSVGAYEAKTHLPALLAKVERGETVTITRHGKPIARLVPIDVVRPVEDVIREMRELRKGITTGGMSIRDMIDEGRR
ncbi:MAG: type II toxin-antitoxin system prevent-host-death family antitoxin [Dermatophilaceae bacterium]